MSTGQYVDILQTFGAPTPTEVDLLSRHTTPLIKKTIEGQGDLAYAYATLPQLGIALSNLAADGLGSLWNWGGEQFDKLGTFTHNSLNSLLPGTDYSTSKAWGPAMHLELNNFHRTLDEMAPSADQATKATEGFWDSVDGLGGGVGDLGGTLDLTTLGMDGLNTSMGMGAQEALAYAGQMGMLEDQTLATVDAFKLLAAVPRMPAGSGGSAGHWTPPAGGGADSGPTRRESIEAERQRILNMPPPANLEDLFLSQRDLGHDISLYASPEAWWKAHKQELANQLPSYASGTPFASGGLALVGEMGPELVNLPRGSQVIPQPRLGREVTVNVTVHGSVVAERDLAQRIRQELIRTSRRTVDLGFN